MALIFVKCTSVYYLIFQDKEKFFLQFDIDANNVLDSKEMGNVNATIFNIFPRLGYKGKDPPGKIKLTVV